MTFPLSSIPINIPEHVQAQGQTDAQGQGGQGQEKQMYAPHQQQPYTSHPPPAHLTSSTSHHPMALADHGTPLTTTAPLSIPIPTPAHLRPHHLRAASFSAVPSASSGASHRHGHGPVHHVRNPSYPQSQVQVQSQAQPQQGQVPAGWTPTLHSVHSAQSSPADGHVPLPLYPYTQSPLAHHNAQHLHPHPHPHPHSQPRVYQQHPSQSPLQMYTHATPPSVSGSKMYHPNVPSAPTPLKRSVSESYGGMYNHQLYHPAHGIGSDQSQQQQQPVYATVHPQGYSQPVRVEQIEALYGYANHVSAAVPDVGAGARPTDIPVAAAGSVKPMQGLGATPSPILPYDELGYPGNQTHLSAPYPSFTPPHQQQQQHHPSHFQQHPPPGQAFGYASYTAPVQAASGTTYHFPAPPAHPAQINFHPDSAPPSSKFLQASIVELPDATGPIAFDAAYREVDADGETELGEDDMTDMNAFSRPASPTPSIESAGSSYSNSARAGRGGRGGTRGRGTRGGGGAGAGARARGKGTKRKAKGSGWTKKKVAPVNKAVKRGSTSLPVSHPPGPKAAPRSQFGIGTGPTAPVLQRATFAAGAPPFSTAQAAAGPSYAAAKPPGTSSHPLLPANCGQQVEADTETDADTDPTAIPAEIAAHLKNLQPGPLIMPPPGCALQIGNLLIHVSPEMSMNAEVQAASKRWAHVIDASGAPMMLDPIRPDVYEQYTCRCCRKTYTGRNARSVARRHLQDKHGVPLVLQERRSRWDKAGFRPRDTAEAHERDKKSKRESAKRAREQQRIAKAKVAAAAKGDESIYTPRTSSDSGASGSAGRGPITHPRAGMAAGVTKNGQGGQGLNAYVPVPVDDSPRLPISPDYSLNSDGSPVLSGAARHNVPLVSAPAQQHQQIRQPQPQQGLAMTTQHSFDERFEQTRQLLKGQGWSDTEIEGYYQQIVGGVVPPSNEVQVEVQAVNGDSAALVTAATQEEEMDQDHAVRSRQDQGHTRNASISSCSDSSWVYLENETPDYVQLRDKQTWVIPPPSVPSTVAQRLYAHGPDFVAASTSTSAGMALGTVNESDTEAAAAGLVDLSSPIKGPKAAQQAGRKKARPTAMRRANTIAIPPSSSTHAPTGAEIDVMDPALSLWPDTQLAYAGNAFSYADSASQASASGAGHNQQASMPMPTAIASLAAPHGLSINTQATTTRTDLSGSAVEMEPAPLSAPASGSAPFFFPATFAQAQGAYVQGGMNCFGTLAESPLVYMTQAHAQVGGYPPLGQGGPSRPAHMLGHRQPFARGRAQLARSLSLSLPSSGSPVGFGFGVEDVDVFSQAMGDALSKDTADAGEQGEGRANKRVKRNAKGLGQGHGRTRSSEMLQPISERVPALDEGNAGGVRKVAPMSSATATGSPVTRGRGNGRTAISGLGMKRKLAGAKFTLSMSLKAANGADAVPGDESQKDKSGPSPLQSSFTSSGDPSFPPGLGASRPQSAQDTAGPANTHAQHVAHVRSQCQPQPQPVFQLAANAFKTPLKQKDLNTRVNANLAQTLSNVDTPSKLEFTTPAPLTRLQYQSKAQVGQRSVTFEPYSTDASSTAKGSGSGDSMLTSRAPTDGGSGSGSAFGTMTPLTTKFSSAFTPRSSKRGGGGGIGGGGAPHSVTRNWADLSSPAHAGLAHQLGLGLTPGVDASAWRTPRALRGLALGSGSRDDEGDGEDGLTGLQGQGTAGLETPGMVDADEEWEY